MDSLWSQSEVFMLAIRAAILTRCYLVTCDFAAVRWQGGNIIIEHTLIRKMLSDLHMAMHTLDQGWQTLAGSISLGAPLTAGQMGVPLRSATDLPRLTSDGIQILGGSGYMEDFPQERLFRDATQCEMLLGRPQMKRYSAWQRAS